MPYTVRWTETTEHERVLTDEQMALLKGISVAELAALSVDDIENGLPDDLGRPEGFKYLVERDVDTVQKEPGTDE